MSSPDYPVTEFAFLNLVPPTTLETPKLVSGFLAAASAQSSWSGHQVHFFYATKKSDTGDTITTVYLISGWASVQAHHEWIASTENQELLRFFGDAGLMKFGGLAHLDIDFTKLPIKECSCFVWRKLASRDCCDNHEADVGKGRDGKRPQPTSINKLAQSSIDDGLSDSKNASESDARMTLKPMAEVLWLHRGRAIDEGATDAYELTGYSEGQLEEFGEEYTVIHRWNLQG